MIVQPSVHYRGVQDCLHIKLLFATAIFFISTEILLEWVNLYYMLAAQKQRK